MKALGGSAGMEKWVKSKLNAWQTGVHGGIPREVITYQTLLQALKYQHKQDSDWKAGSDCPHIITVAPAVMLAVFVAFLSSLQLEMILIQPHWIITGIKLVYML